MEFNSEIRDDCRKLLFAITRKRVSEERINQVIHQFKDCLDFVTEHEVKKSIESLQHKFIIHAEYQKSRQFRILIDKFLSLSKPHGLTHPSWLILHLLFRLAYRPTEKPNYHFVECQQLLEETEQDPEHQELDWGKYLLQGLNIVELPKSDDVWSDSDQGDQEIKQEPAKEKMAPDGYREKIPLIVKSFEVARNPALLIDVIQDWEESKNRIYTEYQILHELLWAMQSQNCTSLVFECSRHGKIRAKPVAMQSLPASCLVEHLSSYSRLLDGLRCLNHFLSDVRTSSQYTYTLTHQAYAASLLSILGEFYESLYHFERRLSEQKVTTTLKDLEESVAGWKVIIHQLSKVHRTVLKLPTASPNHVKASRLLSVLFTSSQEAQVTGYSTVYPVLLRVFFATLRPYLKIIDHWLTEGQVVDHYQEFIITRNESITPQDEHFWHNALIRKTGQDPMSFLERVIESVILAGRSVELLSHVGHLSDLTHESRQSDSQLYHDFIRHFNRYSETAGIDCHAGGPDVEETPSDAVDSSEFDCDNPLLAAACLSIYSPPGWAEKKRPEQTSQVLLTPSEFYPLLPLVEQSLIGPIGAKQERVCQTLLDVLNRRYLLRTHMHSLRGIHLMRDGDLMGRFCQELFGKMDSLDEWRSETSLTLSLINSVASRLADASNCVSVSFSNCNRETAELRHLQINYAVPWPVSLVIGKEALDLYNAVFRFLLMIKRSLYCLQRLSFKEISCMAGTDQGGEEKLTVTMRQHRLQLLRAWLLHFIGSLDYYMMECVLESAHRILDQQLEQATHLGQIIEAHQHYIQSVHKQCLRQPTAAFLSDAIDEVLAGALQVASAWRKGVSSRRLCQLEDAYVRYHQYVASVLGTDAAHSMLPCVETLAAALIHSCPTTDKK